MVIPCARPGDLIIAHPESQSRRHREDGNGQMDISSGKLNEGPERVTSRRKAIGKGNWQQERDEKQKGEREDEESGIPLVRCWSCVSGRFKGQGTMRTVSSIVVNMSLTWDSCSTSMRQTVLSQCPEEMTNEVVTSSQASYLLPVVRTHSPEQFSAPLKSSRTHQTNLNHQNFEEDHSHGRLIWHFVSELIWGSQRLLLPDRPLPILQLDTQMAKERLCVLEPLLGDTKRP
jgi:hypothetical protein